MRYVCKVFVCLGILILLLASAPAGTAQYEKDKKFKPEKLAGRVANREYPSFFQAWDAGFIDKLKEDGDLNNWARHDLSWGMAADYKLCWDHDEYEGLGTGFTDYSLGLAETRMENLHELNPKIVVLMSLYYRDAADGWYPEDSDYWLRDKDGNRIIGFEGTGGYKAYLVNYGTNKFRKLIAKRAKASVATGLIDGIMLDWWNDESAARMKMLKKIRKAIGKKTLIVVNGNQYKKPKSRKYINGLFMECPPFEAPAVTEWKTFEETLQWAEKNLKKPRVNCFATWAVNYAKEPNVERACYGLGLTMSDGYAIFSLCGYKGYIPHYHYWREGFDDGLGKPVEPGRKHADGYWIREYEKGWAVYNPIYNTQVTVDFPVVVKNIFTGKSAKSFVIPTVDGGVFLK